MLLYALSFWAGCFLLVGDDYAVLPQDFAALQKSVGENTEESSALDIESLEVFENIAYIMAKHADAAIPASPDEWLEQFNTFSIYEILPQLIDLWGLNVETQVKSKKNIARLTDR